MRTLVFLALASACWGQAEFEVASIKPSTSIGNGMSMNLRPGATFAATNVTLHMLITFAYDIRDHQLSGGPGWMDSDRYDILARPSAEEAAKEPARPDMEAANRTRQRVRALLADRFKLAVHAETKELPIFALVVAKNGPHLQPSTSENLSIRGTSGVLTCKKINMKFFAEQTLAQRMGRNVVDKTGLAGDYDFEIKYTEDRGPAAAADVAGPDFLNAMQEQLGLKLEQQKGPVGVIVVDHAEKASAN